MPIYEYKCPKCGVFEVTQRITEDALEDCPTCQGKVQKLISNTSFQLKGTGWYVTDYGRGKGANGDERETNGGKDSSDSADSAKSTEGKSTEGKSTESKSTESKSTESKSTESKSTESKSTESKKSEKSSSGDNATSTA